MMADSIHPPALPPEANGQEAHASLLYRLLKLSNLIGRPFFAHFADRYDLTMNDLRVLMTLAPLEEAASIRRGLFTSTASRRLVSMSVSLP